MTERHIPLFPHQEKALIWMKEREDKHKKKYGGILADDPGLGKTMTMLTFIRENPVRGSEAPTLIIVPKAAIEVWKEHIDFVYGVAVSSSSTSARPRNAVHRQASLVAIQWVSGFWSEAPKNLVHITQRKAFARAGY